MRSIAKSFALLLFVVGCIAAQAQDTTITTQLVTVESDYIPFLAPANKETTPPTAEQPEAKLPSLTYSIIPVQYTTTSRLDIPQALQMGKNYVPTLKNNHIRLGFGNYTSPLAEVYYHNLRNEYGAFGLSFKHLSANGPENAKFSDNTANIFGKRFFKRGTLYAGVNYARNAVRYYGLNDSFPSVPNEDNDSTKQVFNTIGANGGWISKEWGRNKMQFTTGVNYYNLKDKWGVQENDLMVEGSFKTNIKKDDVLRINLGYNFSSYRDSSDTLNRHFVNINPRYYLNEKRFKLTLGFNSTIYVDSTEPVFYFLPVIEGEYEIQKQDLVAIAGIRGDVRKNTYKAFMLENPFIGNQNNLNNTINRFEIYGGLRGNAGSNFGFTARVFYNKFNDMAVFISDSSVLQRFKPLYLDMNVVRFNAEIGYQYGEKVRVNLIGNFYNYNVSGNAQKAWQLPTAEVKLNTTYNIGNKLLFKANIFFMNQRPVTREFSTVELPNLDAFADFNLGLEYRYRKTLSLFLDVNNISSVRYQRWYNYPVLGINVMGGITFSL